MPDEEDGGTEAEADAPAEPAPAKHSAQAERHGGGDAARARARPGADRRFRQPGHPADRPARARGRRLLRDRALQQGRRRAGDGFEPQGDHPLRRPGQRASRTSAPRAPHAVFEAGVPVLGICYGEQAMAHQLGGEVEGGHHREFGRAEVEVEREIAAVRRRVARRASASTVWMSHGDRVTALPPGFEVVGTIEGAPFAAIADESAQLLRRAVPPRGGAHAATAPSCSRNFVHTHRRPAAATGPWRAFREQAIAQIRAQVGKGRVICGLSGGVDSLGGRGADPRGDRRPAHLHLRRPRPAAAERGRARSSTLFRDHYNIPLVARRCARAVPRRAGRRHRPGDQAQDHRRGCSSTCSTRRPKKVGGAEFLAQGTLYPDVIESVSFTGGPSVDDQERTTMSAACPSA